MHHTATSRVEYADRERTSDETQPGHDEQRKRQRRHQRPEVVDGQDSGHEVFEVVLVLQNPHEQRDFEADQNADQQDQPVQNNSKPSDFSERQKQDTRRKSADDGDGDLDLDKAADEIAIDKSAQPRTDAHGEQVHADDRWKTG